jgi:hypothetical protein
VLIAVTAAPRIVSMLSTTRSLVRLDLHLDWRMLAFLAGMGTLVTLLFGLAPALRASAVSPNHALKSEVESRRQESDCSGRWLRRRRHSALSCCLSQAFA